MSEQSDKLITEAVKGEHQRLKEWVVKKAIELRRGKARFAETDFNDAVDVLLQFQERHKERLNA